MNNSNKGRQISEEFKQDAVPFVTQKKYTFHAEAPAVGISDADATAMR